jgi:hypothetical chaperone protein
MSAVAGPAAADACGIDFGTSNSTAGWSRPGHGALLALEDGKVTLPSVIFFHAEDAHVSYGRAALADYLDGHEGRMMRSLKSLLGTSMMDEHTEVAGRAVPFKELLAQFIGELKRRAELAAGRGFSRAVLGRPVFFVDDDPAADQRAQDTLELIARQAGLRDISFQYEPIAAAFDYESQISREELVLVVDIGGGTSDFTLIRVGPERARRTDRKGDILASGGVHIGGTDFDKALSLASMMPMLGLGSRLKNGREMPSSLYFNLATWHTINLAYTKKAWSQITELHRDASDRPKLERLQSLVRERAGHWLALQVEEAKITLSNAAAAHIDIDRIAAGETVTLKRDELDRAIGGLVASVEQTVACLLKDAGITAAGIDTVFFTGGSSAVPLLRERVLALAPQARSVEGDLFGSIGAGLALDAKRKFG